MIRVSKKQINFKSQTVRISLCFCGCVQNKLLLLSSARNVLVPIIKRLTAVNCPLQFIQCVCLFVVQLLFQSAFQMERADANYWRQMSTHYHSRAAYSSAYHDCILFNNQKLSPDSETSTTFLIKAGHTTDFTHAVLKYGCNFMCWNVMWCVWMIIFKYSC